MIEPNAHLLDIYRVREHMDERRGYVLLDRNERVTPLSEATFHEILATLKPEHFCSYPDPTGLYERLSSDLGLTVDHLYLTNGSDAAIRMIFQTYLRPADGVLSPSPTYAMYSIYAKIFGATPAHVEYGADRSLDFAKLYELLERRPRLLVIANPDQPTGTTMPEATLRELAGIAHEQGTLFVIDEAYYPFYPHSAVDLVREFDNVVVTRTFSKAQGLAGLRIGFLAADPRITDHVHRIRGAHEVNAVAIAVASYLLDHPEIGEAHVAEVEEGRRILAAAAGGLGLGFPECPTNFQLLRFPGLDDTAVVVDRLRGAGFLVKGAFSSPAVRDCIRVTMAGPEVMGAFAEALRRVAEELAAN